MLSVIVCSIQPEKQRAIRAEYTRALTGEAHELILIDNARSLCEAYNRGFADCRGEIIIFSHDDIEILSTRFTTILEESLASLDLVGVAGTSRLAGSSWNSAGKPYLHGRIIHAVNGYALLDDFGPPSENVEALDGVFLAARRQVCEAVPFDDKTFDGFHFYDLDFSHRAFLRGFKIGTCEIELAHHSLGLRDSEWRRYADRFVAKHRTSLRPNLLLSPGFQWIRTPLGDDWRNEQLRRQDHLDPNGSHAVVEGARGSASG